MPSYKAVQGVSVLVTCVHTPPRPPGKGIESVLKRIIRLVRSNSLHGTLAHNVSGSARVKWIVPLYGQVLLLAAHKCLPDTARCSRGRIVVLLCCCEDDMDALRQPGPCLVNRISRGAYNCLTLEPACGLILQWLSS